MCIVRSCGRIGGEGAETGGLVCDRKSGEVVCCYFAAVGLLSREKSLVCIGCFAAVGLLSREKGLVCIGCFAAVGLLSVLMADRWLKFVATISRGVNFGCL